jgi:hypothetical protein
MVTFSCSSVSGLVKMVFTDTLLPRACPVCARPASAAAVLPFLGPLPRYFLPVMLSIPLLLVVAVVVLIVSQGEAVRVVAAGTGALGGVLGLLAGQGAFRRGRNELSLFLCDEHAGPYRRAEFWRKTCFVVLILLLVFNVVWTPAAALMAGSIEAGVGWFYWASNVGLPLVLLAAAIVVHASLRRKARRRRGLVPRLDLRGNRLRLKCQNLDFARLVELHRRTTAAG